MAEAAPDQAPETSGLVIPFPRTPRRRVAVVRSALGWRSAVLLADGLPSGRFRQSPDFISPEAAAEDAQYYARRMGLPLDLGAPNTILSPDNGPPEAA